MPQGNRVPPSKITEKHLLTLAEQVHDKVARQQFTPLERFNISNSFQQPDRVPIILQIHEHAARFAGLPVRRICQDPLAHVYCQLIALLEYGYDLPCSFADCYNIEVEALGAPLVYTGDRFGEVQQRIIKQPSDLDSLTMPDFTKAGRMPWTLEVNRLLKQLLGDIMGAYAAVTAPFSIAVNLRGYQQLMLDIVENRSFVHRLMEFCTKLSAGFAQIQLQHGAMATSIIDAWASPPLVSLKLFDEFVLPYTSRVIGMLAPSGASWGGIWGCADVPDWKDLVYRVIAAGSTSVRAFGLDLEKRPDISLAEYKALLTTNRRPMLCCVTAKLLASGSCEDIESKVKEIMAQAAAGGGFILYGAMVPIETPPENICAFVRAGKRFGAYPIST
jgi:uroporphyrinogen decarboxylase